MEESSASDNDQRVRAFAITLLAAVTDKARKYWTKNMDLLMSTVQQEDFPLAENIQRDFHSGAQDFVTFGANEPALAYFHRSIKKTLGMDAA